MKALQFLLLTLLGLCCSGLALASSTDNGGPATLGPALAPAPLALTATLIDFESDPTGPKPNGWQSVDSADAFFTDSLGADLDVFDYGSQSIGQALATNSDDPSFLIIDFVVPMHVVSMDFGNDDPAYSIPDDYAELRTFMGGSPVGSVQVTMNRNDLMDQNIAFSGGCFDSAQFEYVVTVPTPAGTDGLIEIVDNIVFEPCKIFEKEIVSGNDVDGNGQIDRVVEVGIEDPAMYDFRITYFDPVGPPVMLTDTVPAEWNVSILDDFYAAPTWSDDSIHYLDPFAGFTSMGSFPAGSDLPNGLGTDGNFFYSGHFTTEEVIIYDLDGTPVGSWPTLAPNLQSLTLVGNELAVTQLDEILFFEPQTGAYIRSIPNAGGIAVEGMTFDGTILWLLESTEILGVDPADGAVITTIPNAASAEPFGGTGITTGGAGELVLAGTSGNWFIVSSADGSVIDSGSNGLDMYGLTHGIPNGLNCMIEGANKKNNGKSATKIICYPGADGGMSTFWTEARCHDNKNNAKCKPTSCGALYLNDGAFAWEIDPATGEPLDQPAIAASNVLCLAAVEDYNGDGVIDYGGGGDEDADGSNDLNEACFVGTDPCNPDSDDDGILDGADDCPLEGPADPALGEILEADGCIRQSQCSDGVDNDDDLLIDLAEDPGCDNILDDEEFNSTAEACEPSTCADGYPACDTGPGGSDCICFATNPEITTGICVDDFLCNTAEDCSAGAGICAPLGKVCFYSTCCGAPSCGPAECTGVLQVSENMTLVPGLSASGR